MYGSVAIRLSLIHISGIITEKIPSELSYNKLCLNVQTHECLLDGEPVSLTDVYKRQLEGNPVTIRFLDPPLHEFVPTEEEDIKKLADAQGKTVEQIKAIIDSLHEFNPMRCV